MTPASRAPVMAAAVPHVAYPVARHDDETAIFVAAEPVLLEAGKEVRLELANLSKFVKFRYVVDVGLLLLPVTFERFHGLAGLVLRGWSLDFEQGFDGLMARAIFIATNAVFSRILRRYPFLLSPGALASI